jgi:hypothetical protein
MTEDSKSAASTLARAALATAPMPEQHEAQIGDRQDPAAPPDHPLQGHIDAANDSWITGWVWDPQQPESRIALELVDGETRLAKVMADQYRSDLRQAGIGDGRHAFEVPLQEGLLSSGRNVLHLRCTETGAEVPGSPVIIERSGLAAANQVFQEPAAPYLPASATDGFIADRVDEAAEADPVAGTLPVDRLGNADGVEPATPWLVSEIEAESDSATALQSNIEAADWTGIRGWIWDPQERQKRIVLELLDGDALLATVLANEYRLDLEQAGIGDGRHGFSIPFSETLLLDAGHVLHLRPVGSPNIDREFLQIIDGGAPLIDPVSRTEECTLASELENGAPVAAVSDKAFVVVLGMHRSGTSLCAHVLDAVGIAMGGQSETDSSNAKGHWERREIRHWHEQILELFSREYYSPRHDLPLPIGWLANPRVRGIQDDIVRFLQRELATSGPFGFKDPRTARLLPMWHRIFEELGLNAKVVLCIRDPAQVARSLKQRDDLPPDIGEYRWFTYMADIFRHLHNFETCIIEYEAWFDEPGDNLGKLTRFLGLTESAELEAEVSKIVDRQLRHDSPDCPVASQPLVRVFYDLVRRFEADPAAGAEIGRMLDQLAAFQQLHEPIASEFEQLSRLAINFQRASGADAAHAVISWRDPQIEAEWRTPPAGETQTPGGTLYVAQAIRELPHEIDAEPTCFRFQGYDLFLHPPASGRTRLYASNIVSPAAGAVLSYAVALCEHSAGPVRFRVRVADQSQAVISDLVAMPGEVRDVDLLLDRFVGPLSIELTTEMSDEGGSNEFAGATFREPRIQVAGPRGAGSRTILPHIAVGSGLDAP